MDLEAQHIVTPDGEAVPFPIAPFARHRLLHGIDEMDFLLESLPEIGDFETTHAAARPTEHTASRT